MHLNQKRVMKEGINNFLYYLTITDTVCNVIILRATTSFKQK